MATWAAGANASSACPNSCRPSPDTEPPMKTPGSKTQHASFTLERHYDAPVALLYKAFSDQEAKSRWFGGGAEWDMQSREFDFRVGGKEHLSGKWKSGMVSTFDAVYRDIVPEQRIVYCYDMHLDGRHISVS